VSSGVLGPPARAEALRRLRGERFDVLVVGGGITGVGIALDAATRGLRVALVEAHDIAAGTSSRSSKLIHGGLRYLEMLDFGLVREALRERRLLLTRLAPHLVRPVPFLFPLRHRVWERPYMGAGLLLYDSMGGARHLPRARHLSKAAALRSAPALRPDSLVGAVRFHDAQEDDARFAVHVARTAAAHGAAIATRATLTAFVRDEGGRIAGAEIRCGDEAFAVRARHTVAAAGVSTDRILELATGHAHHELRPSKGIHLLVPRDCIPMRTGLFMRTEKSIFHAIPWGEDHWLLGDTDTEWDGEPDAPVANRADIEYVLGKVNSVLRSPVLADRVCGVYAGLRPLVAAAGAAATTRLSREHRLFAPAPGLTAIAGGKYTTYRVMARDAVDAAARDLGGAVPASRTQEVPLLGADGDGAEAELSALTAAQPELGRPLAGAERHSAARVVHACSHEGALDLDDVLSRRLRVSIEVPDRGRAAAAACAPLIAPVLGWSDARAADEVARYVRLRDAEAAAEAAPDDTTARERYRAVLGGSA
jgi:glycerol-3-phosphate dehydrogenase